MSRPNNKVFDLALAAYYKWPSRHSTNASCEGASGFESFVAGYAAAVEFEKSSGTAKITPMQEDEKPIEAGTYIIKLPSGNTVSAVSKVLFSKRWHIKILGGQHWHPIDDYEFVARIYPERI